ncbi:MAG: alcohol dehydrogenase catalytic domain-containing protein [Bacillota bacterium]
MKSFIIEKEGVLRNGETLSKTVSEKKVMVRITNIGITATDIAIFKGVRKATLPVVPSSLATGVVSEVGEGVYSCEKGDRVVLVPYFECGRCFECKTGDTGKCQNVSACGVTKDGFACDFLEVPENKIVVIPKRMDDEVAIFVKIVDLAIHICDKLDVSKGENVIIGSAGILGIIIAQMVSYYQATPILIDKNIKNIEIAENFGCGLVLSSQKEDLNQVIMQVTGGKMADSLILISQHAFESEKAPAFVKKGGKIVVHRDNIGMSNINLDELYERNVNLFQVKSYGNEFMMAINLLLNQSVKVDGLYKKYGEFSSMDKTFENLSTLFDQKESILVNIVDMLQ